VRHLFFTIFVVACRSSGTGDTQAPQPLPQATDASIAVATATATASAKPVPTHVCEPTVTCGGWSRCRWLEFDNADAGYDVFHVEGADGGPRYGSHFWRMKQCWPEDAGLKNCAIYCDATGACVDAFTADAVCTVTHAPRPSPYLCEVHGTDCVTVTKP
jgi:hypothetical protein